MLLCPIPEQRLPQSAVHINSFFDECLAHVVKGYFYSWDDLPSLENTISWPLERGTDSHLNLRAL